MRINSLAVFIIIILAFALSGYGQRKKAAAKAKGKPPAAAKGIQPALQKPSFIDVDGREMNSEEFRHKIYSGEFGIDPENKDASKMKLTGIEKLTLKDQAGKPISPEEYKLLISGNCCDLEPIIENGKPIGMKLKEYPLLNKAAHRYNLKTLEGKALSSESQKGKITILNFWFIGCEPCMEELPALNGIAEKYKDKAEIDFISISIDPAIRLKEFQQKNLMKFQQVSDKTSTTQTFEINRNGFPTTLLIDREGIIRFARNYIGRNGASLEKAILVEISK